MNVISHTTNANTTSEGHRIESNWGKSTPAWMTDSWVQIDSCRNLKTFSRSSDWFNSSVAEVLWVLLIGEHIPSPERRHGSVNLKETSWLLILKTLDCQVIFFSVILCVKACLHPFKRSTCFFCRPTNLSCLIALRCITFSKGWPFWRRCR